MTGPEPDPVAGEPPEPEPPGPPDATTGGGSPEVAGGAAPPVGSGSGSPAPPPAAVPAPAPAPAATMTPASGTAEPSSGGVSDKSPLPAIGAGVRSRLLRTGGSRRTTRDHCRAASDRHGPGDLRRQLLAGDPRKGGSVRDLEQDAVRTRMNRTGVPHSTSLSSAKIASRASVTPRIDRLALRQHRVELARRTGSQRDR